MENLVFNNWRNITIEKIYGFTVVFILFDNKNEAVTTIGHLFDVPNWNLWIVEHQDKTHSFKLYSLLNGMTATNSFGTGYKLEDFQNQLSDIPSDPPFNLRLTASFSDGENMSILPSLEALINVSVDIQRFRYIPYSPGSDQVAPLN
jgi:hypothetical protein